MPRFNCTARFDLTTEVEYDGYEGEFSDFVSNLNGAEDVETCLSNDRETVTVSYNEIKLVIEAEDEDEAGSLVEDALEGNEVTDNNNCTWLVESVQVDVEKVEMTEDEAREIVAKFLAIQRALLNVDDETNEAIAILLDM